MLSDDTAIQAGKSEFGVGGEERKPVGGDKEGAAGGGHIDHTAQ